MVKRKRLSSSSSKPTITTTTTTTAVIPQNNSRRAQNSHQATSSSTKDTESLLEVKRSRSTDSADSTSAPQIRGRSAPTLSTRSNGKSPLPSTSEVFPDEEDHIVVMDDVQPSLSSAATEQQSQTITVADPTDIPSVTTSNGQRSRSNKASSVVSSNSTTENPSIPQISVTESSSTGTPSVANGRATASESSLSEIDTVDSEAETERIDEEFDEELEDVDAAQVAVPDGEDENDDDAAADQVPVQSASGISEEDGGDSEQVVSRNRSRKSSSRSPTRGRKRRRRENGNEDEIASTEEKPEQTIDSDEQPNKRSRKGSNDEEEEMKPSNDADDVDAPPEPEEVEEPADEPEEIDEEKAEANKKRFAALEMLREIEEEFAKLRDRIFAERSAEIAHEQNLVISSDHPDIQKLFIELETNRAERIRRAKVTRKYRLQEIVRKYDVEADTVKHQFLADRAMVREKLISELTAQWFQIHREKRAMDMCVPGNSPPDDADLDYGWKIPERRSTQIKYRKAQNYEIMLLDETKKYFGMPSAPKISRISEEETNRDLALMRQRPNQYDLNTGDDNSFYSSQQQQSSSQYIPTGFQDRYYPMNGPPQTNPSSIAPSQQQQQQPPPQQHQHQQHQLPPSQPHLPSPPPTHPTSINSLISHDTPPPSQSRPQQPQQQHHHHSHHHHHHHHHHASSSAVARPPATSSFYPSNPNRLPPLPGSRMNHIVDATDRDRERVKLEPRRETYY